MRNTLSPTIRLETTICADGVEAGTNAGGRRVYRFKSLKCQPLIHTLTNLETPIVVEFVNATGEAALLSFLSRFGWANASDWARVRMLASAVQSSQKRFTDALEHLENIEQFRHPRGWLNAEIAAGGLGTFSPVVETAQGKPELVLVARQLGGYMALEVAMAALHGAAFARCQNCNKGFLTGPMTWRRAHAKYCSDRCRVAAMRLRNSS
jgi:hypothetical protein